MSNTLCKCHMICLQITCNLIAAVWCHIQQFNSIVFDAEIRHSKNRKLVVIVYIMIISTEASIIINHISCMWVKYLLKVFEWKEVSLHYDYSFVSSVLCRRKIFAKIFLLKEILQIPFFYHHFSFIFPEKMKV